MNYLEKEYDMSRVRRMARVKKTLAIISIVSFGSSMLFGMANMFKSALQERSDSSNAAAQAVQSQMAAQARGYEIVLQREQDNQTALEGLVKVRLEMKDTKGALEPLEKLVKLYPDRTDYQTTLVQVKQQVAQGKVQQGKE